MPGDRMPARRSDRGRAAPPRSTLTAAQPTALWPAEAAGTASDPAPSPCSRRRAAGRLSPRADGAGPTARRPSLPARVPGRTGEARNGSRRRLGRGHSLARRRPPVAPHDTARRRGGTRRRRARLAARTGAQPRRPAWRLGGDLGPAPRRPRPSGPPHSGPGGERGVTRIAARPGPPGPVRQGSSKPARPQASASTARASATIASQRASASASGSRPYRAIQRRARVTASTLCRRCQ